MSVYSHSRIDTFKTCPMKYRFCYVDKVPRGPAGIEAFLGSRVHEALEWLYREVAVCRLPAEEDLLAVFAEGWDREWSDDVRIVRAHRTAADYRAVGERSLRAYHRRYRPFDRGTTVGLEMRVSLTLDAGHEMVGFIDRLVKAEDGHWEIHDYKTSSSLMTQQKADADRQLALYELAVREAYPDAERVDLVWHFLAFDHEVRSRRTPEQLEALRASLASDIESIEACTQFPTAVTALCGWCDYQRACPAWRHRFPDAGESAASELGVPSGVELVDEYVAVSAELSELRAHRDDLRARVVALAEAEGLERLFGTDHVLSVCRTPSIEVPAAGDPRRDELEAALADMGILHRFSTLSVRDLARAVADGELEPDAVRRIEPYLTRATSARVSASRLR